ncbi:hypothetical protein P3S68_030712 [Capsicum galapagoense]
MLLVMMVVVVVVVGGIIVRVLSNLVLAIGLTYLTMTGQLGWVLDAIVSVWLLAVLLPILGLGAFIWWAGRDIVQGTLRQLNLHLVSLSHISHCFKFLL